MDVAVKIDCDAETNHTENGEDIDIFVVVVNVDIDDDDILVEPPPQDGYRSIFMVNMGKSIKINNEIM